MNLIKFKVLRPIVQKFLSKSFATDYNPIVCDEPIHPIIVTLVGANSMVGQTIALLLKQCSLIDELRLFDYSSGLCGTALDLSHIDTNVIVKSYTGLEMLQPAILNSKVVAVCGGESCKPDQSEYELFKENADFVRTIALYTAEFNPKCVFCIATPPITAMVPLVSEEYKKAGVYDARHILGVTTLGVMRANSIVGEHGKQDPNLIMCPVVGGMGSKTCVAVVSQTKIGTELSSPVADVLRNKVSLAEYDVLNLKYTENAGPCTVSTAYATSRFVTSAVRGILGIFDGFECAFVRQTGKTGLFLPYMASLIKLGKYGVDTLHMPSLDSSECLQLQRAAPIIRNQIFWGESYVTGETKKIRRRRCKNVASACNLITTVSKPTRVGDITVDIEKKISGGLTGPF